MKPHGRAAPAPLLSAVARCRLLCHRNCGCQDCAKRWELMAVGLPDGRLLHFHDWCAVQEFQHGCAPRSPAHAVLRVPRLEPLLPGPFHTRGYCLRSIFFQAHACGVCAYMCMCVCMCVCVCDSRHLPQASGRRLVDRDVLDESTLGDRDVSQGARPCMWVCLRPCLCVCVCVWVSLMCMCHIVWH